jgi:hypothetical protein
MSQRSRRRRAKVESVESYTRRTARTLTDPCRLFLKIINPTSP